MRPVAVQYIDPRAGSQGALSLGAILRGLKKGRDRLSAAEGICHLRKHPSVLF